MRVSIHNTPPTEEIINKKILKHNFSKKEVEIVCFFPIVMTHDNRPVFKKRKFKPGAPAGIQTSAAATQTN